MFYFVVEGKKQKSDHLFIWNWKLVIFVDVDFGMNRFLALSFNFASIGIINIEAQTNESHDEIMLLFELIDNHSLWSDISHWVCENICWNCDKNENIHEDKNYKKSIYPYIHLDGYQLVVRIRIKSWQHIYNKNGFS